MPSTRRRMALTLTPETEAAIMELAEAMEKPAASVVVGLLGDLTPQLLDLAKVVRHARAGNKSGAKRALSHMVGNAMAEMMTAEQLHLKPGKK